MKKIFVSVPFAGSNGEILREIQMLQNEYMMTHGYTAADLKSGELSFVDNYDYDPCNEMLSLNTDKSVRLACLSDALLLMACCDDVIFSKNWQMARGCRVEHLAYELYMREGS